MDILQTLSLSPADTPDLPASLRSKLLNFLIRWEYYEAALACLDVLQQYRPKLVSLYDARAKSLLGLEQIDAALAVMRRRLGRRRSIPSRILEARLHLAAGENHVARAIAEELVADNPDSFLARAFLGDAYLEEGDLDAAEQAYQRVGEMRPHSRRYALSMARLYHARGDFVSASAWAVRLESATDEGDLTTLGMRYLRWLHRYYDESGEPNRAADVDAALTRRYETELADLRRAVADFLGAALPPEADRERTAATPSEDVTRAGEPPPVGTEVIVTPAERDRIETAVRQHFGFERLLPGQVEVMTLVLRGESVLAVMPTGGGKSLCYQLPALLGDGTTLVVSPLIALMKDQVDSLPDAVQRHATTINSTLGGGELYRRLRRAARGGYRLIYAAPERLRQPPFLDALRRANVSRLVVDEAHCVSLWGHDFRPDYLFLAEAARMLGDPPILAMTATAPARVRADIMRRLGDMALVITEVHRPNLQLEAIATPNEDAKLGHLVALCTETSGAGIVYAHSRAKCEELARVLRTRGIAADYYHAGIGDRAAAQDAFMQGDVRVVVATVAFGMGIDKSDIRFIIHYNLPRSLEAYYQEAGRAGRDGDPSRCVLFHSPTDRGNLTRWANQDKLAVSFLRDVYAAIGRRLDGACGRVATDDLMRDLTTEETQVRVAISLLEEAGLLKRHVDVPRTALITLRGSGDGDPHLAAFARAGRLVPGQSVERDLVELARAVKVPPAEAEYRLLQWQARGRLDYRPAGRDLLLEQLPPPDGAQHRVSHLLETYAAVQEQRIEEIVAYAKTRRCRHGHISAYFGGQTVSECGACDNCLGLRRPAVLKRAGDERRDLEAVLTCVDELPWPYGLRNLTYILRGSPRAPQGTADVASHGALLHRSTTAVQHLVTRLVDAGLLQTRTLDHGGEVVELTPAGHAALTDPSMLESLV